MIVADARFSAPVTSGTSREATFGLSEEGLAVVLDILRNQLYADKKLAVVREISCNAYDAMQEVGKGDRPFEVTLPTAEEPIFRVRDFGRGLSSQEIVEIFVQYGASTKRQSNAFIGQKGIGAKCPFAYGDSFMVISYQGGSQKTYTAYLDPSFVGKMALLSELETTEEDGLEVIVPIKENDINDFCTKAIDFFRYWKVRPTFKGVDPAFPPLKTVFQGANEDWFVPDSREVYTDKTPKVIMGNVPYRITCSYLDWTGRFSELRSLLSAGVHIYVNIGQVEVSAGREDLQYTPATQQVIFERLEAIHAELATAIQGKIDGCQTMYQVKLMHCDLFDLASPFYPFRTLFQTKLSFRGEPVNSDFWTAPDSIGVKRFRTAMRRDKVGCETIRRIEAKQDYLYVVNDLGSEVALVGRLAPLLERHVQNVLGKHYDTVYLLQCSPTDPAFIDFQTKNHFDAPICLLSKLPKMKLCEIYPSDKTKRLQSTQPKYTAKVFRLADGASTADKDDAIDGWEVADDITPAMLATQEGVFVPLVRFLFSYDYPFSSCDYSPRDMFRLLTTLEELDIEVPDNLFAIKLAELDKRRPAKMVSLRVFLKEAFKKRIAHADFQAYHAACVINQDLRRAFSHWNYNLDALLKLAPYNTTLAKLLSECKKCTQEIYGQDAMAYLRQESIEMGLLDRRPSLDAGALSQRLIAFIKKIPPLVTYLESSHCPITDAIDIVSTLQKLQREEEDWEAGAGI